MAAKEVTDGGEASQGWKTRFAFGALAIAIVGIVLQAGGAFGANSKSLCFGSAKRARCSDIRIGLIGDPHKK